MNLTFPDYAVLFVAVGSAVWGLFIGFSGAMAFLAGLVASVLAVRFGWVFSADFLSAPWARGLVTLVLTLLAFGLIRAIVRKCVHGLLAQPADAIFGSLVAFVSGGGISLSVLWLLTYFELVPVDSVILRGVLGLV